MAEFDQEFWEQHWGDSSGSHGEQLPVNPHLPAETAHLPRGTALDAGCGTGAEARWLAAQGWKVTAADISAAALATARDHTPVAGANIDWVEADLMRWEPGRRWDLVVSSYVHVPSGPTEHCRRLASWVAPGGTLLIVGHLEAADDTEHGGHSPDGATATAAEITQLLDPAVWRIETAAEQSRPVRRGSTTMTLHDAIVRAHHTG